MRRTAIVGCALALHVLGCSDPLTSLDRSANSREPERNQSVRMTLYPPQIFEDEGTSAALDTSLENSGTYLFEHSWDGPKGPWHVTTSTSARLTTPHDNPVRQEDGHMRVIEIEANGNEGTYWIRGTFVPDPPTHPGNTGGVGGEGSAVVVLEVLPRSEAASEE